MTPKDWTLLVIAAAKGEPLHPVQLQKALFLLGANLDTEDMRLRCGFYGFRPYDYGPFCASIYTDAEILDQEGLVTIASSGARYRLYAATPAGLEAAERLRSELPTASVQYLERTVQWVRSLSFNDLVRAIYKAYPAMKANSVFRE